MKYALGNMLNGAGGLNPDGLAIDLQFATDRTLTARRGPTPVLTRGSGNNGGTTYFGPSSFIVDFIYAGSLYSTVIAQQPSLGLSNGRWRWGDGSNVELKYNGTSWELLYLTSIIHTSSPTTAWLPDNADWGTTGVLISESGDFGIVKAANDEPRFDHNPVSPFACRGLLIEEGRTNLFQRSEEFSNTYWAPTRAPQPTANAAVSPDGTTTADKLIADTTPSSNHRVDNASIPLALSTVYTLSIYAKASEYTGIALGVGVSLTRGVDYSLVGAGTATPVSGAGHTGTIQQLANGWYRCTATFTSDATTANHRVAIYVGQNGTTFTYTGDNTSGIFIWGAQIEAGSFATSYIPTTTIALARSADVCSITGANFTSTNFFNPSAGTIIAIGSLNTANTNSAPEVFKFNDGTTSNRIQIGMTNVPTEGIRPFIVASGTLTYNSNTGTATIGVERKIGTAYSTNDAISVFNGTLGTQDITVTMPTGINQALIGVSFGNGTIASIRYYRKRLPNAKLQALTA